ncbi:MAG: response regulator transcription factor [Chloroflexi bacterium]|nr:response regulator transcription factor [Chloroflexota bacterium]
MSHVRSVRLLLAVDREYRRSLRQLPALFAQIDVVGEAESAREIAAKAGPLSPDVVLLDVDVPEMNGLETVRILRDHEVEGKVIVLSSDTAHLEEALSAGAVGYLLKSAPLDELLSVLRSTHREGFVFGASVMGVPEGMETALRYMASRPGREEPIGPVLPVAEELSESSENESGFTNPSRGTVGYDQPVQAELAISGPVDIGTALKIHEWLREAADIELSEIAGSWSGDVTLKINMSRPVPIMRMLAGLPQVESVFEEPISSADAAPSGVVTNLTDLPEFRQLHSLPMRYRIILKAQ